MTTDIQSPKDELETRITLLELKFTELQSCQKTISKQLTEINTTLLQVLTLVSNNNKKGFLRRVFQ